MGNDGGPTWAPITPGVELWTEFRAMTFARGSLDLFHDPVPAPIDGLRLPGEEVAFGRWHGRAEQVTRYGEWLRVKVAGRVDAETSFDADLNHVIRRFEPTLWDTQADLFLPNLDIRFGNQILAWGTADMISPNDVMNPRDLRRGVLDRPDELRIPLLALTSRFYQGPVSLTLVWIPKPKNDRIDLLHTDQAILGPRGTTPLDRRVGAILSSLEDDPVAGQVLEPILGFDEDPEYGFRDGEIGASAALRLRGADFLGYFFWGHERTRSFELASELRHLLALLPAEDLMPEILTEQVGGLVLAGIELGSFEQRRRLHLGGAIATRIEPLGLKLDIGYGVNEGVTLVPPERGVLFGEMHELNVLGATLSVDYDLGAEFMLVVEGHHSRVCGVPENRRVFQFDGDQVSVLATRAEIDPFGWPVSLSLLAFLELAADPSYGSRPAVRWSRGDRLSIEINALVLSGRHRRDSQVQFTIEYGI